jgi:hypothetical protein
MDSRKTYAVLCAVMNRETHRTYQFDKFCTYLPLSLSLGKLMLFYVLSKAGLLLVVVGAFGRDGCALLQPKEQMQRLLALQPSCWLCSQRKKKQANRKIRENNKKKLIALWEEILQILHFNSEKGNGQMTEPERLTSYGQRCNDVQTKVVQA